MMAYKAFFKSHSISRLDLYYIFHAMKQLLAILLIGFLSQKSTAVWQIRNTFIAQLDLFDMSIDGDQLYAVGYVSPASGYFMSFHVKSSDGGKSWSRTQMEGEFHKSIEKRNGKYFVAGFTPTGKSFIKSSSDFGATWKEVFNSTSITGLTDIQFISDDVAYASGYGSQQFATGALIKTVDGGETWQVVTESDHSSSLDKLQFISSTEAFAISSVYFDESVNGNKLSHSTNGGKSWEEICTHGSAISGLHFVSETKGFLTDIEGKILITTDGGKTWNEQYAENSEVLFDIEFTNSGVTGMAIGANGTAFLTEDGGATWVKQNTSAANMLLAVRFHNQTAYTMGVNGTLLWDETPLSIRNIKAQSDIEILAEFVRIKGLGDTDNLAATVYTLNGKELARENGISQMNIEVSQLPAGIYILNYSVNGLPAKPIKFLKQ